MNDSARDSRCPIRSTCTSARAYGCAAGCRASARRSWPTRSGLTFQQVQKYERGANRVSASKLYEIAAALRAPVGLLLRRPGRPHRRRTGWRSGDGRVRRADRARLPDDRRKGWSWPSCSPASPRGLVRRRLLDLVRAMVGRRAEDEAWRGLIRNRCAGRARAVAMTAPDRPALRTFGRVKSRPLKPRQAAADGRRCCRGSRCPTGRSTRARSAARRARSGWRPASAPASIWRPRRRAHPDTLFLGAEPFVNGVAACLAHLDDAKLANVRLHARRRPRRYGSGCRTRRIDRLYVLFPDPWPKTRHKKRRLIQAGLRRRGRAHAEAGRAPALRHRLGRLRRLDAGAVRRPRPPSAGPPSAPTTGARPGPTTSRRATRPSASATAPRSGWSSSVARDAADGAPHHDDEC